MFSQLFSFFQRPLISTEWSPFVYLAFTFLHMLNLMDPISHVSFTSPYSGLSTKWLKWLRRMSPYPWLCASANNLTQDYPSWSICCSSPQEEQFTPTDFFFSHCSLRGSYYFPLLCFCSWFYTFFPFYPGTFSFPFIFFKSPK